MQSTAKVMGGARSSPAIDRGFRCPYTPERSVNYYPNFGQSASVLFL
ncbi:hypothetical protein [Methanothrix soehngenii]